MKLITALFTISGWVAFTVLLLSAGGMGGDRAVAITPQIGEVQEVVNSTFGPEYQVKEIDQDGALYRLVLAYKGYSVDTIYLREDRKTLMRAETLPTSTSVAVRVAPNTDDARKAYHASIKRAMEVAGNTKPPVQTVPTLNQVQLVQPPTLPREADAPDLPTIYESLHASRYVKATDGSKVLYMFDDFRCPGCRDAEAYLGVNASMHDVEVRYLPVSVLGPDSQALAAYVLESDVMLQRAERARLARSEPSKVLSKIKAGEVPLSKEAIKATLENFQHLLKSDRGGTPTFIYLTKDGVRASTVASEQRLGEILGSIVPSNTNTLVNSK